MKDNSKFEELLEVPELEPCEFVTFRINHRKNLQVIVEKDESSAVSWTVNIRNGIDAEDIYGRISENLDELRKSVKGE